MITVLTPERITSTVAKRYPPEFRRKVLDLVGAGRRIAQVAADLDISEQGIYIYNDRLLEINGELPPTELEQAYYRHNSASPRPDDTEHRVSGHAGTVH